jgi:hypothetical protein
VPKSILEAIKLGFWDYEPPDVESMLYAATDAMPGTQEKLSVLAQRVREGLPLWHPRDRDEMDDPPGAGDDLVGAGELQHSGKVAVSSRT